MDWRDAYNRKLVSAEQAAKAVKDGDRVVIPLGCAPNALAFALAARRNELRGVQVILGSAAVDYGWYDPGWEESFQTQVWFGGPIYRPLLSERRGDYAPWVFSRRAKTFEEGRPEHQPVDVLMLDVTPPDEHGFCGFGSSVWSKKQEIRMARTVLAQVNSRLIRTFGDNLVHVSEIHQFVEQPEEDVVRRVPPPVDPHCYPIAEQIKGLVKDGDTLQIGLGTATQPLPQLGTFNNKVDLGWHSELTAPGIVKLVQEGVINGKRKTVHPGKAVGTSLGNTPEDRAFINMNPMFELYGQDYIHDPCVIAAHANMVAINNAIAVDLTGQINAESIGPRMHSGTGGQLEFALGAFMSRGGRAITVVPSTAANGTISRIVPILEPGSVVSVPRNFADIIVSEHGVARLLGKSLRQRADALIAIAHPDFRSELRKEAKKLFYP